MDKMIQRSVYIRKDQFKALEKLPRSFNFSEFCRNAFDKYLDELNDKK